MKGRDFTLLWSASAGSQLGNMCSATANPLLALLLTGSPVFAGWICAAGSIPALLMYLPAGWFVDRFNRRLLMFVSQSGLLVVFALLVTALVFGPRFEHLAAALLVAAAFCNGVFLALYSTAEVMAVQRVVNSAKLPSALARNEVRSHLAIMLGKPLGGFLFSLDKAFPYCMSVLTAIWSIIALSAMDEKDYQPRDLGKSSSGAPANPKISFFTGLKVVILNPFLRTEVVLCAIGNFCFQLIILLLIVLAQQQHMSGSELGLLLATSGIGGLIGSIAAPRVGKRIPDERTIVKLCAVTWTVLTLIVAVAAEPVIGLIAWGSVSVTGGLLNVAIITYQTRCVPEHMLGRVMGITRFLSSGVVPLGALSAGYIVTALQPRATAWLAFVAVASATGMVPILLCPRKLLPDKTVDRLKARLTPAIQHSPR